MNTYRRLSKLLKDSDLINIDDNSKFFITSDCHRGDGSWKDDFAHNQNVYFHALKYYYDEGFSYVELGDGDEMWQNSNFDSIKNEYPHIFSLFSGFNSKNRLFMLWGNHDDFKKDKKVYKKYFEKYYHEPSRKFKTLMPKIIFRESLLLNYKQCCIFMVHGHQGDFINDQAAFLGKLLVRYLWGKMQAFGIKDPTSTASNADKKNKIENKLIDWAAKETIMLIAGHTHRAMFPKPSQNTLYFNTGSCIHPRCITGIEIDSGFISLVKWHIGVRENGDLYINREKLQDSQRLDDYFENIKRKD